MNLLFPAFLGAVAAIGLPVLLHFLRLQPKQRVAFPTLRFLGPEALRDSRRHRLMRWLTLLLRCLLIALVAVAFSRPFWPLPHSDHSRAVVVVVDNSYSMQALGRREAVEKWLAPLLADLRPPDELGVLLLEPSPTWLVRMGRDLDGGRAALHPSPLGYATTHYRDGLEMAAAVLATSPAKQKQILFAADEQRLGWNEVNFNRSFPPGIELMTAPAAPVPRRQAAITALHASRSGSLLVLEALVRGYAPTTDYRKVTFSANGRVLGARDCEVIAGSTQAIQASYLTLDWKDAQAIRAALDPDELTVDDSAYAVLAAINDHRVMLAPPAPGQDADYLAQALATVRGENLPSFAVDPLSGARTWPVSEVAILRGAAPFAGDEAELLQQYLSSGGSAWLICDGSPEQAAWLKSHGVTVSPVKIPPGGSLGLRDLATEHRLFAPFIHSSLSPLLAAEFSRGWSLAGNDLSALARWPDRGIAIAEIPLGAGRLLVTGFTDSQDGSNFPLQAGYVPFVNQAAVWLSENSAVTPDACRVGDRLALPGPGTWNVVDSPLPAALRQVDGTVTPIAPGLYEWKRENGRRLYAVNLDTTESDLTPWPTPTDFSRLVSVAKPAVVVAAKASVTKEPIDPHSVDERQVWWWLLASAVIVLFLELGCANRVAS